MNTPESICVDFLTAQKLKEAGFPQGQSVLCWSNLIRGPELLYFRIPAHLGPKPENLWDAPTLEEVLRELPDTVSLLRGPEGSWLVDADYEIACLVIDSDSLLNGAAQVYIILQGPTPDENKSPPSVDSERQNP